MRQLLDSLRSTQMLHIPPQSYCYTCEPVPSAFQTKYWIRPVCSNVKVFLHGLSVFSLLLSIICVRSVLPLPDKDTEYPQLPQRLFVLPDTSYIICGCHYRQSDLANRKEKRQSFGNQNVHANSKVIVALVAINASAIETMPILLDRISNSIVAISVTCLVILLFDEILPLVVCQKYGLSLGAYSAHLVLVLMYLCYPISFPLGYILDVIIGKDVGHLYRRQELKELISRHGPRRDHFQSLFEKEEGKLTEPTQFSGQLSSMEVQVIRGILGLSKKTASDALVPLNKVFMVDYQDEIDKEFVLKVLKCAHRHIPVYSSSRKNIVCCISARRVLRVDPNFRIPVYKFIRSTSLTPSECLSVFTVPENQPLFDVVRKFRLGTLPRLAFVVRIERRKIVEVIGITSQQDVLKAMFTDEEPPQPKPYRRDRSSADRSKMNNGMPHDLSNIETFEQS